ncbi:MAG: CHASE2 domain-containing protein [Merismopedia sp. SIO2A8]|nr:CHASE2 domain-containing protein [Merismopedia sp. SIO2A8]
MPYQNPSEKQVRDFIAALVSTHVIQNWEASDEPEHLRTIRDRLLRGGQSHPKLLRIYRSILQTGRIPAKDTPEHLKLRFSGAVEVYQGQLRIKNPIYSTIFNQQWVEQAIKSLSDRPLGTVPLPARQKWIAYPAAIAIGLGMTTVIILARVLGVLEGWELNAFDYWMRSRPPEGADERLFMVTITETDIASQPVEERGAASLSDETLARLIKILEQGKPRVIGLDVYRNQQVDRRYPALAESLAKNDQLFTICHYGKPEEPGKPPPSESPKFQHGFNSVAQDVDGILRRQVLAVSSPEPCKNEYSWNWWLAASYLYDEGIKSTSQGDFLQLGAVPFKRIQQDTGGYRRLNNSGHQILLNYRATDHIAETATLQEVFSEQFDLQRIQDRIVLIGVVAPTFSDHDWFTPYSRGGRNPRRMSGVEIQAHMTSQIISAVLDGRPLLWTWPEAIETLWIGIWTVTTGVIIIQLRSPHYVPLVVGIMVLSLGGLCWVFICYAGWIPFVPAALGIVGSGIGVNAYRAAIAKE